MNDSKHTPGSSHRDVIEGLNAITDNAASWTPAQTQEHAQSLAVEVDALRAREAELLAALREVVSILAQRETPTSGDCDAAVGVAFAAIAKAEGGQS